MSIDITVHLKIYEGEFLRERELDEIPSRYLPWLSSIKTVLLSFSRKVDW